MAHCVACDVNLSDFEATRKVVHNNGKTIYPDLCNACYRSSGLREAGIVLERYDLSSIEDTREDYDEDNMKQISAIIEGV